MELKVGIVCDRGLNSRRPINEDRFLAIPGRGLFAVFDGVGGQSAGEIASQTAAETIEEALTHDSAGSSLELVRRAIQFANRDIYEMAEGDPQLKTMATTVALLHVDGERATIAHVGDSRVYRLENGRFYRETIDHTDLNDDIRAGRAATAKAEEKAGRNVINRALGVERDVDVELKSISVRDGARFLLCSDGVYRHLSDEEIARVLAENKDPQRAADELKRIVHERGADDNLTAVVVQAGRARQSAVLAVEDGLAAYNREPAVARTAEAGTRTRERGGRIQVEMGNQRVGVAGEQARGADRQATQMRIPLEREKQKPRDSHKLIWALAVITLMAASFYIGLRASDWLAKEPPVVTGPVAPPDPLRAGRDAFDKGDYQSAMTEFDSVFKREPQNVEARYWLGRAQFELGQYPQAAQNLEEVTKAQPAMRDAYIYAAAAYQATGNAWKAAQMIALWHKARNERAGPNSSANANVAPR